MSENNKTHWAKQLYFYVVLGVSLIALVSSAYTFVHINLTKFVFDDLHEYQQQEANYKVYEDEPSYKWDEEKDEDEDEDEDEKDLYYQSEMIGSILTFGIALGVIYLNLKYVNPGDTIKCKK